MRIHILTQPLGHNYGGNLQAFALQRVLLKMGHEVVTLDRQWNAPPLTVKLLLVRLASLCKSVFLNFLGHPRYICNPFSRQYNTLEDKSSLRKNIQENLCMSAPLYSSKDTEEYIKSHPAEIYIVGSDQVWRKAYCPSILDYFLSSVPDAVPKISYAASFGKDDISEYSEKEIKTAAELIKRFKAVSVREESGVDICKEKFGVNATKVLDPTLLLDSNEYLELLTNYEGRIDGHYLGVYILDDNEDKQRIIKKASIEHNLPINIINVGQSNSHRYRYPSIEEWIANIAFSDFVITDSFHGMVFSILFEKQFLIVNNKTRGSARFESLLSQLGISGRVISDYVSVPKSEIDYDVVNRRLQTARQESLGWLHSQLTLFESLR